MPYRGMTCEMITINGDGGTPISAYTARPAGNGPFPGVVLVHHLPGWSELYIEMTRKFAHNGYIAIFANLSARAGKGHPDDVAAGLDARIVMDVVRYPKMFATNLVGPHEPTLGSLVRWTIDPRNSSVDTTVLDDRRREVPRGDPRVETREHRVGYGVALGGHGGLDWGDILGGARGTGEVTAHSMGGHRFPSEAVFVPRGADAAIDDGWLLATVYDDSTGRSEAIVLDAQDLAADPVATVHLPVRVPFGFHGNWVAAPS